MNGITIRNLDPAIKERLRVRHNQGLRGQADDPQGRVPHARTRRGGGSVFCEPPLPPRRLIGRNRQGEIRRRSANATEPAHVGLSEFV